MFICEKEEENLRVIKRILRLFELMSGLRVNFNKCKLFGLNISEQELNVGASLMNCETGKRQFVYLGMKIRINNHRKGSWSWLAKKVKNRIACWKDKNISMGGRATLLQSVLSSIPIYTLSFHVLPKSTILEIIKIQRAFLWEGNDSSNKISWVSWSDISKKKGDRGLGIKDLGNFNKALVGKWIWRILEEESRLWVKVLNSRYGSLEENREVVVSGRGGSKISCWWKDLCRLYWGKNGEEGLRNDFTKILGKGENTIF